MHLILPSPSFRDKGTHFFLIMKLPKGKKIKNEEIGEISGNYYPFLFLTLDIFLMAELLKTAFR